MSTATHTTVINNEPLHSDKLPSWAEISSLSDEELLKLFEASQHKYPQRRAMWKPTSVRRIASDAVMKVGYVPDSEILAMGLVRETTNVPVPAVLRSFLVVSQVDTQRALIMTCVPGGTLEERWSSLSLWRRFRVIWDIRRYIRQLRRIVVPGTPRDDQPPGPIASEPQVCRGIMFTEYDAGPFASYKELTLWFMHKLEVNRSIRKTPTEDIIFDSSLPLVLTHLELYPHNIVLDNDHRPWFIDWEMSGFYPQWFEYASMLEDWEMLGRWKLWIVGFMAGFYKRQATFLASISWALGTGCLL